MALVSVNRFRKAFPEFTETSNVLIDQKLQAAELRHASSVWGNRLEQGIMWLTAHLLSSAPEGQLARLKKENRGTIYKDEWDQMKLEVTAGAGRVT